MAKRTDEQLREIIGLPAGDYQPEAVEAAKQELKKRELKGSELWKCVCGEFNDVSEEACRSCGLTKDGFLAKKEDVVRDKEYFTPMSTTVVRPPQSNAPELALKTIATIVMVCGVIISVVLLIVGIILISDIDEMTGLAVLLSIIPVLLYSLVIWGLLRVFCNISINIKEIKAKL